MLSLTTLTNAVASTFGALTPQSSSSGLAGSQSNNFDGKERSFRASLAISTSQSPRNTNPSVALKRLTNATEISYKSQAAEESIGGVQEVLSVILSKRSSNISNVQPQVIE